LMITKYLALQLEKLHLRLSVVFLFLPRTHNRAIVSLSVTLSLS